VTEGTIAVPGGNVWYRIAGADRPGIPLLCLHGGPGFPHDYLESMEDLADRRPVIFYDQLGCGRSDRPDDPAVYNLDRSVEEVAAVLDALQLHRLHLFGNSWGGWLALQFTLDRKPLLASLILSSSPPSVPRWISNANDLRARLPKGVQAVLDDHEARGVFDCPEYTAAIMVFYKRHLCRLKRWPDGVERALGAGFGVLPYRTMWGPSEFGPVLGNLNGWDVTDRVSEITAPTLITGGRHDEASPEQLREMHERIAGSELVIFDKSSHMAFAEERKRYMATLNAFMARVEASFSSAS
jgi:proline iminopeptidase